MRTSLNLAKLLVKLLYFNIVMYSTYYTFLHCGTYKVQYKYILKLTHHRRGILGV